MNIEEETTTNKANIHDKIDIDEQEVKAIEVNPKDTLYNNIKINDAELQAEVAFAKMRWNETDKEAEPQDEKKIFDTDSNTVDLSNKKATEMRSNTRVKVVDPDVEDAREIKRDNLKIKIIKTYEEYIAKNCNKNGEIKSTVDEDKKAEMIKVKKKVNQNVIKVINTDKTNRFSVMKPNTYSNSMKEHHEHDKQSTRRK